MYLGASHFLFKTKRDVDGITYKQMIVLRKKEISLWILFNSLKTILIVPIKIRGHCQDGND